MIAAKRSAQFEEAKAYKFSEGLSKVTADLCRYINEVLILST